MLSLRRLTGTILILLTVALGAATSSAQQRPSDEWLEGRGERDMVLIHGLGSSVEVWDGVAPYLNGSFRVFRFELSGHGGTGTVENPSIAMEVERLHAFLQENDLPMPVLVGHGLGGMIALTYTLDHPADVKRLVLMDTAPKQLVDQETKVQITQQMLEDYDRFVAERFLAMSPVQDVTDQIVDQALRTDSASFISLLMSSFDYDETQRLRGLSVPMLVIGSELMFPTSDESRAVLDKIGFDKARTLAFKRMGRTGHFMMLEQPVYIASVILAFGLTDQERFERVPGNAVGQSRGSNR